MRRRIVFAFLVALALLVPGAVRALSPAPVITLVGDAAMTVDAAFAFEDPGATAVDYLGRDLTDRITVEGEVIPYLVGEYVLTYAVADEHGAKAQAQRTVTVVPVALPQVVQPPKKTIYLTFDDGPGPSTEKLLDILKQYDVKATFFVVGNQGRKELIRRAYEEGHSIGVHSYTHRFEEIYVDEAAFFADFLATEAVILEQTGQYTPLFRFPGGSGNTVSCGNRGLMTRLTGIMEDMGYRYFDWNVNSLDASHTDLTSLDFFNVIRNRITANGDGFSIVLQHDTKSNSVFAVEDLIRWGLENGYTFLPLTITSPTVHAALNN